MGGCDTIIHQLYLYPISHLVAFVVSLKWLVQSSKPFFFLKEKKEKPWGRGGVKQLTPPRKTEHVANLLLITDRKCCQLLKQNMLELPFSYLFLENNTLQLKSVTSSLVSVQITFLFAVSSSIETLLDVILNSSHASYQCTCGSFYMHLDIFKYLLFSFSICNVHRHVRAKFDSPASLTNSFLARHKESVWVLPDSSLISRRETTGQPIRERERVTQVDEHQTCSRIETLVWFGSEHLLIQVLSISATTLVVLRSSSRTLLRFTKPALTQVPFQWAGIFCKVNGSTRCIVVLYARDF